MIARSLSCQPRAATRGDVLRGWNQSGLLALVFAHLFSLELVREIFAKQIMQGKGPIAVPAA